MQSKVVRSEDVIAESMQDELIMADIDAGMYYGLNNIASTIWKALADPITVEDLCKNLCESHEVTIEQCAAEVLAFLNDLSSRNLIHAA